MKKVSIIVPVYNSSNYIVRCLDSIKNQTYQDIEIIVINDGSKDNSLDIINKYKKDNPNIDLKIYDQGNVGVAETRNRGIRYASGEYIMFIDNDDFIEDTYVTNFADASNDYDIVIGGYKRVSDTETLFIQNLKNTTWSKYIVVAPWAKLYKKDFLIKNNIKFLSYGIGEDVYFNLFAYTKTDKINVINNTEYNWYYNDKSVSNTDHKGFKSNINLTCLLDKLNCIDGFKNIDYNIYFMEKFCIWYLLYSGKTSTPEKFIEEYKKLKTWLKENNYKNHISPFSIKLDGESFKNRIAVFILKLFDRLGLMNLFSKIYCKG